MRSLNIRGEERQYRRVVNLLPTAGVDSLTPLRLGRLSFSWGVIYEINFKDF